MKIAKCANCGEQTIKLTGRYNETIKKGWNFFCSIKCRYSYQEKGKEFLCAWCEKPVKKTPAQLRQTKENVFCTKSCAAHFNNRNKKFGTRRSKLEIYLGEKLKLHFPEINLLCNTTQPINLELDFYFPDLKLAIEINGFLHYQPIYGIEKLNRIQELDKEKTNRCIKLNIQLIIIDVSREPHLTQIIKEKHWTKIEELVTSVHNGNQLKA